MPFNMAIPDGMGDCADAWGRIARTYDSLAGRLAAMPRDPALAISNAAGRHLGEIDTQEFVEHFPLLEWNLATDVATNGGVGSTQSHLGRSGDYSRWRNATTLILRQGCLGYDARGDDGRTFLCLHECAHTTTLGQSANDACWHEHVHDEGGAPWDIRSPAWDRNERTANDIALAIARRIGVNILTDALPGYREPVEYDFPPLSLLDVVTQAREMDGPVMR